MGTINPRARGGASLSGELRARRLGEEQVRRQLSKPPRLKPAAPVVASGGGIVGMAQLTASGGSVQWGSGQNVSSVGGVTYGSPSDANAGSGGGESSVPVSSWLTTSGHVITLEPGWYIPVLYMRFIWDDPANSPLAFGGPFMYGGFDTVHNDYGIHAAVPYAGGRRGFVQIANYGPTYMGTSAELHAECRAVGGNPTGASNPAQSAIVWDITKLG